MSPPNTHPHAHKKPADDDAFKAKIANGQIAVMIYAPQGAGKTLLSRELRAKLGAFGRRIRVFTTNDQCFFDEAQEALANQCTEEPHT